MIFRVFSNLYCSMIPLFISTDASGRQFCVFHPFFLPGISSFLVVSQAKAKVSVFEKDNECKVLFLPFVLLGNSVLVYIIMKADLSVFSRLKLFLKSVDILIQIMETRISYSYNLSLSSHC